jgi:hypothetical protein
MTDASHAGTAKLYEKRPVTIDRLVMTFAGTVILVSLILALFASQWWLLLTAFVGANLLQSSFTGFCPLAKILRAFGVKPGAAF